MCCECNQTEIRSEENVTLQPGVNEIIFKKKGEENSFKNRNYTFIPFNIDGSDLTIGTKSPDKIIVTSSNLTRINYIATSN